MNKEPFFAYSHKFYIKYEAHTKHWVGLSLIQHIDADELFNRRVIISELESILNYYDTIDSSVVP